MIFSEIIFQFCIFCVILIIKSRGEDQYKQIEFPKKNCSHMKAVVSMYNFNERELTGLPQVLLSKNGRRYYMCHSSKDYEFPHRLSRISHALCRQLGYATYENIYERDVAFHNWSLRTDNIKCFGNEQHISSCSWKHLYLERCSHIMGVQCSTCSYTIAGTERTISSPGYRQAYIYTLLCEWKIIAPEHYEIQLIFQHFQLPVSYRYSLECDNRNPYIEILYGFSEYHTVRRYCEFNKPMSMQIPFRNATIRFYSGLYNVAFEDENPNYGFVILFRSEMKDFLSASTMKILATSIGLLLFFILVISCYCCRRFEPKQRCHSEDARKYYLDPSSESRSQDSSNRSCPFNRDFRLPLNCPNPGYSPSMEIPQPLFQVDKTRNKDYTALALQVTPETEKMTSTASSNPRSWLKRMNLRKMLRSGLSPSWYTNSGDTTTNTSSEMETPKTALAVFRNSHLPMPSCSFYVQHEGTCTNRKRSSTSDNKENEIRECTVKIPTITISPVD